MRRDRRLFLFLSALLVFAVYGVHSFRFIQTIADDSDRPEVSQHLRLALSLLQNTSDGWWDSDVHLYTHNNASSPSSDLLSLALLQNSSECNDPAAVTAAWGWGYFYAHAYASANAQAYASALASFLVLHNSSASASDLAASWAFSTAVATVGPSCSAAAVALLPLLQQTLPSAQPAVMYAATSEALSNRAKYPAVARTIPSDLEEAKALASLFLAAASSTAPWRRLAIVFDPADDYSSFVALSTRDLISAAEPSAEFLLLTYDARSVTGDAPLLLQTAAVRGFRVMLLAAPSASVARTVLQAASDLAASTGHNFQWIATQSWAVDTQVLFEGDDDGSNGQLIPAIAAAAAGALGVRVSANSTLLPRYHELWASLSDSEFPDADGDRSTIDPFAPFAVDALVAIAVALQDIEDRLGVPLSSGDMYAAILNATFTGLTGSVAFSALGERDMAFDILNLQQDQWQSAGVVAVDEASVAIASSGLEFADGLTSLPSDRPEVRLALFYDAELPEMASHAELLGMLTSNASDGFLDAADFAPIRVLIDAYPVRCGGLAGDGDPSVQEEAQADVSAILLANASQIAAATAIIAPPCVEPIQSLLDFAAATQPEITPVVTFAPSSLRQSVISANAQLTSVANSVNEQANMIAAMFEAFDWTQAVLIWQSDHPPSTDLTVAVLGLLADKVDIAHSMVVTAALGGTIPTELFALAEAAGRTRIVLCITSTWAARLVLQAARFRGILGGDDGFVWVGSNAWLDTMSGAAGSGQLNSDDFLLEHVHGAIGPLTNLAPSAGEVNASALLSNYKSIWAASSSALGLDDADGDRSTILGTAPLLLDATLAVLLAVGDSLAGLKNWTSGALTSAGMRDAFDVNGFSGALRVAAGARLAPFTLANVLLSGAVVSAGSFDPTTGVLLATSVTWPDGSGDVPASQAPQKTEASIPWARVGILAALFLVFAYVGVLVTKGSFTFSKRKAAGNQDDGMLPDEMFRKDRKEDDEDEEDNDNDEGNGSDGEEAKGDRVGANERALHGIVDELQRVVDREAERNVSLFSSSRNLRVEAEPSSATESAPAAAVPQAHQRQAGNPARAFPRMAQRAIQQPARVAAPASAQEGAAALAADGDNGASDDEHAIMSPKDELERSNPSDEASTTSSVPAAKLAPSSAAAAAAAAAVAALSSSPSRPSSPPSQPTPAVTVRPFAHSRQHSTSSIGSSLPPVDEHSPAAAAPGGAHATARGSWPNATETFRRMLRPAATFVTEDDATVMGVPKERVHAAAMYCLSALIGLERENREVLRFSLATFQFYFSSFYQDFVFPCVCVVHILITAWEPTTSLRDPPFKPSTGVLQGLAVLEVLCLCVYLIDLYLQHIILPRSSLRSPKGATYALIILLVLADVVANVVTRGGSLRFSRPFRAAIPVLHSHTLESDVKKILMSCFRVLDIVFIVAVAISWVGVFFVIMYGAYTKGCRDDLEALIAASNGTTTPAIEEMQQAGCDSNVMGFDDISLSSLSIFILTTADNFPEITYAASERGSLSITPITVLYLIFVFVLLAVLLAAVFDAFVKSRAEQVTYFRTNEKSNLRAAFDHLRERPHSYVTIDEWRSLMFVLKPSLPVELADFLFKVVDTDGNGTLDRNEFMQTTRLLLQDFRQVRRMKSADRDDAKGGAAGGERPPLGARQQSNTSTGSWSLAMTPVVAEFRTFEGFSPSAATAASPRTRPQRRRIHARRSTHDRTLRTLVRRLSSMGIRSSMDSAGGVHDAEESGVAASGAEDVGGEFEEGLEEEEIDLNDDFEYAPLRSLRLRAKALLLQLRLALQRLNELLPRHERLERWIVSRWAFLLSLMVIIGNIAVFCLYRAENRSEWAKLNRIDNGFMIEAVAESVLRLGAMGFKNFMAQSQLKFDLLLVLLSSVVVGFLQLTYPTRLLYANVVFRTLRWVRLIPIVDLLFMKFEIRGFKIRSVMRRLVLTLPMIWRMALLIFVVIFFFTVIGMELWSGRLATCSSVTSSCVPKDVPDYEDPRTNFNYFSGSLRIMLSVMFKSELSTILSATIRLSQDTAVVYWLLLYISLVVLMLNVFSAVTIESFQLLSKRFKTRKTRTFEAHGLQMMVKPSRMNVRYRLDLDIEEARRVATLEEVLRRFGHKKVNEILAHRVHMMVRIANRLMPLPQGDAAAGAATAGAAAGAQRGNGGADASGDRNFSFASVASTKVLAHRWRKNIIKEGGAAAQSVGDPSTIRADVARHLEASGLDIRRGIVGEDDVLGELERATESRNASQARKKSDSPVSVSDPQPTRSRSNSRTDMPTAPEIMQPRPRTPTIPPSLERPRTPTSQPAPQSTTTEHPHVAAPTPAPTPAPIAAVRPQTPTLAPTPAPVAAVRPQTPTPEPAPTPAPTPAPIAAVRPQTPTMGGSAGRPRTPGGVSDASETGTELPQRRQRKPAASPPTAAAAAAAAAEGGAAAEALPRRPSKPRSAEAAAGAAAGSRLEHEESDDEQAALQRKQHRPRRAPPRPSLDQEASL